MAKSQLFKKFVYFLVSFISLLINLTLFDFKIEEIKDLFPA